MWNAGHTCDPVVEQLEDWLVVGGFEVVVPPVAGSGQAKRHLVLLQMPQESLSTCASTQMFCWTNTSQNRQTGRMYGGGVWVVAITAAEFSST